MAEPGNTTTIIGADTHISGEMRFGNSAKILGTFEGKITAKGELQVAEGATCRATVDATDVVIDGVHEGDVHAKERVQLNPKARMAGDLIAAKLVVAEGASFVGHCTVGPDAPKGGGGGGAKRDEGVVEVKAGEPAKAKQAEPAVAGRK